jgi:hypothetical protein
MLAKHVRSFTSKVYELYRVCVPIDPESSLPLGGKDFLRALGALVVQQV